MNFFRKRKGDSAKGRGSRPGMFCKKGVLKNFTKCTRKDLCRSLFLIKLSLELYQKETPLEVISFELCKIFQSNFFTEQLRTTDSGRALDFTSNDLNTFC